MRRRHALILGLLTLLGAAARAQALAPAVPTEVFLVPFEEGEKKTTRIGFLTIQREGKKAGKPVNISKNAAGDDDLPQFLPDSTAVLFTSKRGGTPYGIYRYDIASGALVQAPPAPEGAGAPSGRIAQLQLSPTRLAIVGPDATSEALQLIDLATGASDTIEPRAGRSLVLRPGRNTLTYIRKTNDGVWIKEVDPATRAVRLLTEARDASEAVAWTPKGTLVTAAGAKLFFWEEETDRWLEFGNLAKDGVQEITRISVSADGRWMAVVGQPQKK
jgi:hypothetical protein